MAFGALPPRFLARTADDLIWLEVYVLFPIPLRQQVGISRSEIVIPLQATFV